MPACWSDLPLPTLPNGQCHPFCCFALLGEEGCSPQHPRVPSPGPLSSCGLPLGHEGGCRALALCRSSSLPCSPDFFSFFSPKLGLPWLGRITGHWRRGVPAAGGEFSSSCRRSYGRCERCAGQGEGQRAHRPAAGLCHLWLAKKILRILHIGCHNEYAWRGELFIPAAAV